MLSFKWLILIVFYQLDIILYFSGCDLLKTTELVLDLKHI